MYGLPHGIRLNNPFNIKQSNINWIGKITPSSDPIFEQFIDMGSGIHAGIKILLSYYKDHGLHTIQDIITRWAPSSDGNPTSAYIGFVCQRCGVGPTDTVNVCDPGFLLKLASAIIEDEQGSDQYVSHDQIALEIGKIIMATS